MARLVLAIGTSHSPALNTSAEEYAEHEVRDRERWKALDKDGRPCTYDDLMTMAEPRIRDEIRPEVIARRVDGCNRGMAKLAGTLQ